MSGFTLVNVVGQESLYEEPTRRALCVTAFDGEARGPCLQFDVDRPEHVELTHAEVEYLVERLRRWLASPTFDGCRNDLVPALAQLEARAADADERVRAAEAQCIEALRALDPRHFSLWVLDTVRERLEAARRAVRPR